MESFAITNIGEHREINQDYVYCTNETVGLLPNLYIVADGMGGHRAGDFASRFSVSVFEQEVKSQKTRTIIGTMENAIRHANEQLIKEAATSPDYEGMGTTLVAATIAGDTLYVANVGDSRLYLMDNKANLRQITQDHSLVEEMILKGEIERKDAKYHPKKNVITRALGASKQIVPDFFETGLEDEEYILLCSDGLTNMVEDSVIREVLMQTEMTVEEKTQKLVDLANENGGKDNISVILIHK